MIKTMKVPTMILALRFLIVCTTIAATLGNPLDKQNNDSHTVHPISPFYPQDDADLLYLAVYAYDVNAPLIIDVIAHRSESQRVEIAQKFYKKYKVTLEHAIQSRFGDKDFGKAIEALLIPLNIYYAKELNRAMKDNMVLKNSIMSEILVPLNVDKIEEITAAYKNEFGSILIEDVRRFTSENYGKFLHALIYTRRWEGDSFYPPEFSERDATKLYDSGAAIWGTNETPFYAIFTMRSYSQLRAIFEKYEKMYGVSIEDVIRSEFSDQIMDGLLTIVGYARNKMAYFAERLHTALMMRAESNDNTLIRMIVTHSEIDLRDIAKAYQGIYKRSLVADIANYTSDENYNNLLLVLAGQ